MSAAPAEVRTVVARNFPAAWVSPDAIGQLPQKIVSLLQRIGPLDGVPVISQTPSGQEVFARFQTAEVARDAVQTLHGTDLRSAEVKRAAKFQAPKDSERFWLQIASEIGAAIPTVPAAPPAPAVNAVAKPPAPAAGVDLTVRKRVKPHGVCLTPLPPSWSANDVEMMAKAYGPVASVKLQDLGGGVKAAYIDYQRPESASSAQQQLDGLQLSGSRMRCAMQEETAPMKPLRQVTFYLDELPMPSRPEADPRLDERELFITELPRTARTEEAARAWLSGFGEVEETLLLKDHSGKANGKAYARFRTHADASKALKDIRATAIDGSQHVNWSESERALHGIHGPYGLDVLRRFTGERSARLQEIARKVGGISLALMTTGEGSAAGERVHFVVSAERSSQVDECRSHLATELTKVHETFVREVKGSLVLRGFSSAWSEKALKFVFAPFGGMSSVVLEEEQAAGTSDATRLAYVKLKNESMVEKAAGNLHQTKVGDNDIVEECVVDCNRWHPRAWSDGSFLVPVFLDQLTMNRRPQEVTPGSEDRELFVQNLPLQDMNRQQLQEYFEGFGEVEDLHLATDTFTLQPTGEGYVRFRSHRDAQRCIEALTPKDPQEAESTDLAGSWSESERALQRKENCYRFNLVAEVVGADGSGLERIKNEAKLQGLWLVAETLRQKDRSAPPPCGKQLHFVARLQDEAGVRLFHEILERTLQETHTRISERIEKRKRKAETAAAAPSTATAAGAAPAAEAAPGAGPPGPNGQGSWPAGSGAGAWVGGPPPYWGGPGSDSWGRPPAGGAPAAPTTVFEQAQPSEHRSEDKAPASSGHRGGERRSRSRRRRRRGEDGGDRERRRGV